MQIETAIRDLKVKLSGHYMIQRFQIQNVFDVQADKEVIQVDLFLSQLRDCESDFTKMLRMIRQVVPVSWPVKLKIRTEL